jgi:sulfur carrier protein
VDSERPAHTGSPSSAVYGTRAMPALRSSTIFPPMTHMEVGSEIVAIVVNGEPREIPAGSTVASLLASLELDPRLVVVERNREILRDRDSFGHVELATDDAIEIVHFVGGG